MTEITIVTAFFDIGRGNIKRENAPDYMTRTNSTYFEYFSNLSKLENDMVIFTSPNFENKIRQIRQGKPTIIILLDFDKKFQYIKNQIRTIQNSESFISRVRPDLLNNIEYWSAEYVLINNLKTYFVNKAIQKASIRTKLVSWVDFGYIRSAETLNNIKLWQYDFDENFVHLFSIKRKHTIETHQDVLDFIFNNKVYVIGGVIVANKTQWHTFMHLLHKNQKELMRQGIVDDDQGLYMMCLFQQPNLFKVNYLGKEQWFSVFKKYDNTSKISLFEKLKDYFI